MATLVNFDTHGTGSFSGADVTYGNRIVPAQDCEIQAVRFRSADTGTYTLKVTLWGTSGPALTTGSLTQAFTSGQSYDIPLSSPITLTAGTTYWVGGYSSNAGSFAISTSPPAAPETHGSGVNFDRTSGGYFVGDGRPDTLVNYCCTLSPQVETFGIESALTPASESNTAQSVARAKRKVIDTATETGASRTLTTSHSRPLMPVAEIDHVGLISNSIVVRLATVAETSEAPALGKVDPIRVELSVVTEAGAALPVTMRKGRTLSTVSETNAVEPIGGSAFFYRLTFPTYPRSFQTVPIGQTVRFVLDQAVSIVRINGSLRQFRTPSQTMLEAAGTEGVDWFIGGRIYDHISFGTALELQAAGFEAEKVEP